MKSSKHWSIVLALAAFLPMHNVSAEVVTVSNPNGGAILSTLQDMGQSIQNLDSLVVTGTLNDVDFAVLNGVLTKLAWLDLSGTDITEIPNNAFGGCNHIVDLIFPSTLVSIGESAFESCHSLSTVQGVDNVEYIRGRAFLWTSLKTLPFGEKIVVLEGCSLMDTQLGGDIVLPESLETLDDQAFRGTAITSVDLSRTSIGYIGYEAFMDCHQLKNLSLPQDHSFTIQRDAFRNCELLTSVIIPRCVTNIEERAFAQGDNYDTPRTVIINSQIPFDYNMNAFSTIYDQNLTLWVPAGSLSAYRASKSYLIFGNIKEHGFSLDVEGNGYVSFLGGEYGDGDVCLLADDSVDKAFTFVPAVGYEVESVTLNGTPVALTDNGYTVSAETVVGSFDVKFAPKSLQVTVTSTAGGQIKNNSNSISSGTVLNANGAETVKLNLIPDEGYFVKSVKFNGVETALIDGVPIYETPVLSDNATVAVEFGSPSEYAQYIRIDLDKHGPGEVRYNGTLINTGSYIILSRGSSPVFTFVPGAEGHVQSLLVNSFEMVSSINENTLSLVNLAQDVNMKVDFFSTVDVQIDSPNGHLREMLDEAGIVPRKIKFLKLTGYVTKSDLAVIQSMLILYSLDLSETTLTEIPNEAFKSMTFSKVDLPLTMERIGVWAFYDCKGLIEVTGFENIRTIENYAFQGCDKLENLPFGDKIDSICYVAFDGCRSLPKDIVMPPSLRYYGPAAFGWDNLNSMDLSQCTFESNGFSYYAFSGATSVLLPEKGNYSLGDLAGSKIKSIIIPAAVTSVGFNLVDDAEQLKDIYMRSSVPPSTGASSFNSSVSGITLHVPTGSIDLYNTLRPWCYFGSIVEEGIGIKSDGNGVVYADGKRVQSDYPIFANGNDITISLVPNPGYEINGVLLDDSVLTAKIDGTYLIPAGKENGTLSVGWKLKRFGITVNYQGNGAILCGGREMTNGEVLMADSASVVRFDIAPSNGYLVKNISFNGIESVVQNGGTVYVTPAISGASTLDLTFAEQTGAGGVYQFDIATGDNGAIVYRNTTLLQETSINISAGQDAIFEINPKKYYKIDSLFYNGVDVTESIVDNKFTVSNVSAAGSISVSFCADTKATVALNTEGTLGNIMFQALKDTLEWLIVTGPMNDADFSVIRNDLRHLKTLDLSGAEITVIPDGALYHASSISIESISLPANINNISCDAFKGLSLKSITLNSATPFEKCESAFSQYAIKMATVNVPLGAELAYRNDSRWSMFEYLTDGVVNNKDDRFETGGHRYVVTDIENRKVEAVLSSVAEYDSLPAQVSIDGLSFTVNSAKLEGMDSKGYIMLLTNGSEGPWEGKYWYSDEKIGDTWNNEPSSDWMNPDFDDSRWTVFKGPIASAVFGGYTDWQGVNDCYWIRRSFQLDKLDFCGLKFIIDMDDEISLYVNGINVYNGGSGETYLPASYFKIGKNVIAAKGVNNAGPGCMDFSIKCPAIEDNGMFYEFTNLSAGIVSLIGSSNSNQNLIIPSTISFLGKTYNVTSIAETAFADYSLDSITVNSSTPLTIYENSFSQYAYNFATVHVPVGSELVYRNNRRWSKFGELTDGVVNNQDDKFVLNNIRYVVTDFENRQVEAVLRNVGEYDSLPAQVSVDGMSFTVHARLESLDSKGYLSLLADGSNGPWEGKYWYSNQKTGNSWNNSPADDWMSPDYDDSDWTVFAGPITTPGYGGYTDWQGENDCYWMRRTFQVDLIDFDQVTINVRVDDQIELFINGVNVHNGNYSGGTGEFVVSSSYFKVGRNVVAAKGVNTGGPGFVDFSFKYSGLDIDGLKYEFSDFAAGEVTLMGASVPVKDLVVPATISLVGNTYKVVSIAEYAFKGDTLLTTLSGMENVKTIGRNAFENCQLLEQCSIPEGVQSIEESTFYGCIGIQGNLSLPSTLINLGRSCFYNCKGITSVNIPAGVKIIDECAFENCSSLVNVEFSEGLVTIGGGSFRATGVANADLPLSLKEIGDEAFAHCGGLVTISMKPNLTTIGAGAFSYCSALKSIETPSSVTTVKGAAFARCENLETAILSEGLKYLEGGAFSECMMLNHVYLPSTLKTLGESAFSDCRSLEKITIGDGITVLENGTFYRCAIDSVIIPSTVRTIKNNVFAGCNNLVYVSLPEGLTAIWGGAFYECGNLVSINLPQSLTTIGSGAFKSDVRLSDLVIPESVNSIESEAFRDCRSLSSLSIPASVKSIGINALRGIPMIKMASATPPAITSTEQFEEYSAIVIPDGAYDTYCNTPYWKQFKNQFTTQGNLTRVVNVEQDSIGSNLSVVIGEQNLPFVVGLKIVGTINSYDIMIMRNKMTLLRNLDLSEATIVANDYEYYQDSHTEDNVIGANSFRDINLCSVVLPNNAKRIGSAAFHNCRYLTGIVVPDAVEYIDDNAFSDCGLLKTAYIGDGVKTIESYAFNECNNLTDLHLGKNLTAIGYCAFHSCDNLKNIEFGKKLLYISGEAFSDCYSLTDVVLPGSLIEIGGSAFRSCSKLKEVKIPSSVKNIGNEAFSNCPLEKVYTYTIEPTNINQNTFSCYKTARLYVPATSYYNYYWNTQWSQFTELVEFNEPYEYFYLNGDYTLNDVNGRIDGTPDMEMNQTSGITIEGDSIQEINTIELNYNANNGVGASIIAGNGNTAVDVANLIAQNMNVNIGVDANRWYFFCFPFDLAMDSVECTSDYVFYSYDGLKRAQGLSGWVKVTSDVTMLNKGNGYIFQSSRTGILTIHVGSEYLEFKGKSEQDILHSYESNDAFDASWNFLGNPFISYYDIQDLAKEYDAPIVVWNGNGYDVYKPGDDDYQLKPFEAFFVQKANGKSAIEFLPDYRITYSEAQTKAASHAARRARMGTPMDLDRQLVNISITSQDSLTDRTRIVYSVNASMDYEIGVDAAKFQADGVPQIYTLNGKTKYAINERPMGTDEIKLGYTAPTAGTYTLSLPRHDAEVEIYDNVAKCKVDFTFGDYTFQTQSGTYNDRFVVYKTGGGVTKVENGFRLDGMTVKTVDGGIDIEGRIAGKVSIYNEAGMLLAEPRQAGRLELGGGTYIVKVGDKSIKLNVLK